MEHELDASGLAPMVNDEMVFGGRNGSSVFWSIPVYCSALSVFVALLWLNATILYTVYLRYSRTFRELKGNSTRRAVVMNVLQIIYTSAAGCLQLLNFLSTQRSWSVDSVLCVRAMVVIIGGLHAFELSYRPNTPLPIIIHRSLVVLVLGISAAFLEYTQNSRFLNLILTWSCLATMDQTIAIASCFHIMARPSRFLANLLHFAAVYSFLPSLISTMGALAWSWGCNGNSTPVEPALGTLMSAFSSGLVAVSIWRSCSIWHMGNRARADYRSSLDHESSDSFHRDDCKSASNMDAKHSDKILTSEMSPPLPPGPDDVLTKPLSGSHLVDRTACSTTRGEDRHKCRDSNPSRDRKPRSPTSYPVAPPGQTNMRIDNPAVHTTCDEDIMLWGDVRSHSITEQSILAAHGLMSTREGLRIGADDGFPHFDMGLGGNFTFNARVGEGR